MGEIRVFIPDEVHADILELGKANDRRLPEEVTALLVEAVGLEKRKLRRPPLKIVDLADGHYYPNGERIQ
jgi:hypothetical protein